MALAPGDTNEAFIREVDENLRRSQAEDFFRRYGRWLIGGALLLLLAVAALLYWRNQQAEQTAGQSEALAAVINDIGAGNTRTVDQRLAAIAEGGSDEYAGLAKLTGAALALQQGKRPQAVAAYKAIAADDDQPQAVRDAALLREVTLEFDRLKPEEVIARLQPLTGRDSAWFGSAAELTATAMLKGNRRTEAGRMYAAIAARPDLPASLRGRAAQMAGSLGADVAAPLPTAQ